jgi:hypothetical protein
MQQIVNKDDPSLDLDPASLLSQGDVHWFDLTGKKPVAPDKNKETDAPDQESPQQDSLQ